MNERRIARIVAMWLLDDISDSRAMLQVSQHVDQEKVGEELAKLNPKPTVED